MDAHSNVAPPLPSLALSLRHLSDTEILAGTRRLVARSNQLMAELLGHLAEVEARGIHRTRACSSLYAYCIYELRFSEDEAFRRVAAARLIQRFSGLLDALASGELHLTGLLMLGPHLTEANLTEVLARAKHRTKREVARLVRALDPLPPVPARIEPLGPGLARAIPADPTWDGFVQSFCPVRELSPGERPRDWLASDNNTGSSPFDAADSGAVDANEEPMTSPALPAPARVNPTVPDSVPRELPKPESLAPERYKVQFTATTEHVRLIEEAQALLSHAAPRATLDEIHLRALRSFVALLRKQKYATADVPSRQTQPEVAVAPLRSQSETEAAELETRPSQENVSVPHPRRRVRHIPAAVRRAVFNRDGQQCTHVEPGGRRCAETHRLEFHHLEPFARGGEHTAANLTLRCAAHNALAAEDDFGRELILRARGSCRGRHIPGGPAT
jgi:hypothetical protein